MEDAMAEKKILGIFLMCGLFCLFLAQYAGAADTIDVELQQSITSLTPVYVDGHEGDNNWIAGFAFDSDISIGAAPLGTLTGTFLLVVQPMDFTRVFDEFSFQGNMSLPGYGTCALTGCGMAMTASAQGDLLITFSGNLDSCTESLTGIIALASGAAEANIFLATGESTILLRIPAP
jgi:hypothetical protein